MFTNPAVSVYQLKREWRDFPFEANRVEQKQKAESLLLQVREGIHDQLRILEEVDLYCTEPEQILFERASTAKTLDAYADLQAQICSRYFPEELRTLEV